MKNSIKSQAFVKAMTAHIEADGKFESAPEPVSEPRYGGGHLQRHNLEGTAFSREFIDLTSELAKGTV